MSTVVMRNTPIPVMVTKEFTTAEDNQTSVLEKVFEGERSMTKDNNLLGKFTLTGIPPLPRGVAKQYVTFDIEAVSLYIYIPITLILKRFLYCFQDGVLTVTAVQGSTGSQNSITITNDENRLTKNEMERMILDAECYRQDDLEQRKRATAGGELEGYCKDVLKLLAEINHHDKKTLEDKCEQTIKWLDESPSLPRTEEMTAKKKEIQCLCNRIASLK